MTIVAMLFLMTLIYFGTPKSSEKGNIIQIRVSKVLMDRYIKKKRPKGGMVA